MNATDKTKQHSAASPSTATLRRIVREPFLHFVLLGTLIFGLNAWRESKQSSAEGAPRIEVTDAVIERLRAGYERQFGQAPDEDEMRGLVTAHIREEVLYREAMALGLERDDTIVRRRLAQKMEFLTDDVITAVEPDDATLREFFTKNASRYASPAHVSFRHVYFSKEKRGANGEAATREALAALGKGASDETMGDAFLHGFEFAEREPADVVALFGAEFTTQLAAKPVGAWVGPIASSYGLHLVRVDARGEPQAANFDAVRSTVMRDFEEERRRMTNREVFDRLRARYEVAVDEAALKKAAAPKVAHR